MKDTSCTGHGYCRCSRVYLPPMAVPEPLIRKQLLQNTAPKENKGSRWSKFGFFLTDASEMQPGFYYRRCLRAKDSLAGKVCTRNCCEKNMGGAGEGSVQHCSV